ncbi:MAG: hypothetical protein JNN15_01350, partial [Blastocatellia bacterium]|nr:hypothetical protein [Blastocatellia bacterium]
MNYIWIIPLLPLLGFLINGLLANKLKFSEKLVGIVGSTTIAIAFLLSTFAVIEYSSWSKQPENREKPFISQQCSYVWLDGGEAAISEGKEAGKA